MVDYSNNKSPFEFNETMCTVEDLYAKTLCEIASEFIKMLDLSTINQIVYQKIFGWFLFIMLNIEKMPSDTVYGIISSIQRNMLKANWSEAEINNFFGNAIKYSDEIIADIANGDELDDAVLHLFFGQKSDRIQDSDFIEKHIMAIYFCLKCFHNLYEKISNDHMP